jgi:hypothetical protein
MKGLMKLKLLVISLPLLASAAVFSLTPKLWRLYGLGLNHLPAAYEPAAIPSGATGFQVTFPQSSTGYWAGYLLSDERKPLSGTLTITANLVTTGTPVFNYNSEPGNTCIFPAHFRPYIQSGESGADGTRWWSNPSAFLLAQGVGTVTLTIPLTPNQWSGVFGEWGNQDATTIANFGKSLANPTYIGLTAGGGCFFGHGVNVSGGTAAFQVSTYSTF